MAYYVLDDQGNRYGPADDLTLQEWVHQGRIDEKTVLENEESGVRLPAIQVPATAYALRRPVHPKTWADPPVLQPGAAGFAENVPNHMLKSIGALVAGGIFCLPSVLFGLAALIHAARVDGFVRRADYFNAEKSSNSAGQLANVGLVFGVLGFALQMLGFVLPGIRFFVAP